MNKFKVGDLVRGIAETRYSITNTKMKKGKITRVFPDEIIEIAILEHDDKWCNGSDSRYPVEAKHFELIQKPKPRIIKVGKAKFIFNPPYTIVTDGTHTGKAKCNPAEEYDPITGLEIAKKRFEEAKFPDKSGELLKEVKKLVKPEFRVGDEVEITGGWYHNFKIGDIGVVTKMRNVTADSCEIKVDTLEQSIEIEDFNLVEKLKVGDRVEMIKEKAYSFDRVGNTGKVVQIRGNLIDVIVDGFRNPTTDYDGYIGWIYEADEHYWKKICTR